MPLRRDSTQLPRGRAPYRRRRRDRGSRGARSRHRPRTSVPGIPSHQRHGVVVAACCEAHGSRHSSAVSAHLGLQSSDQPPADRRCGRRATFASRGCSGSLHPALEGPHPRGYVSFRTQKPRPSRRSLRSKSAGFWVNSTRQFRASIWFPKMWCTFTPGFSGPPPRQGGPGDSSGNLRSRCPRRAARSVQHQRS